MAREFKKLPSLKEARAYFKYDPESGIFKSKIDNSWTPRGSITAQGKSINYKKLNFNKLRFAYLMAFGKDPSPKFVVPIDGDLTNARKSNLKLTTYSESQKHNSGASWGPCLGCLRRLGLGLDVMSRMFGINRGSMSSKASRFSGEDRYTGFDDYWRELRRNKDKLTGPSETEVQRIYRTEWMKEIKVRLRAQDKHDQLYFDKYQHLRRGRPFTKRRARKQVRRVWYQETSDKYAKDRLGCTVAQFRRHIIRKLKKGWTEENYGVVWNFDHIKPCIAFDLTDDNEVKKLNHYTNIRPMCVVANRIKSGFC